MFDIKSLKVGDKVGIYQYSSATLYTVSKIDKVKIVVRRESDGYERKFSAKSGREMGDSGWHSAYLESAEDFNARNAARKEEQDRRAAWKELESAATSKSIEKAEEAIAKLKTLLAE